MSDTPDLQSVRLIIDACDTEILSALAARFEAVGEVAAEKERKGLPVYDAAREAAVFEKLEKKAAVEVAPLVRPLYRTIMAGSRRAELMKAAPEALPAGSWELTLTDSADFHDVTASFAVHGITPDALVWTTPKLTFRVSRPLPGSLVRDWREHGMLLIPLS